MKRWMLWMLICAILFTFCGCAKRRTDISREEIVAAYEEAGYRVSSKRYDETLEYGQIGYVQAEHPDGNYIYFSFFESDEAAKAYKKEFYHPGMMGLFSAIFGNPRWPRWEVYGCMVVQYDDPDLMKPFQEWTKSK